VLYGVPPWRSAKSQIVAILAIPAENRLQYHSGTANEYCPSSSTVARPKGLEPLTERIGVGRRFKPLGSALTFGPHAPAAQPSQHHRSLCLEALSLHTQPHCATSTASPKALGDPPLLPTADSLFTLLPFKGRARQPNIRLKPFRPKQGRGPS